MKNAYLLICVITLLLVVVVTPINAEFPGSSRNIPSDVKIGMGSYVPDSLWNSVVVTDYQSLKRTTDHLSVNDTGPVSVIVDKATKYLTYGNAKGSPGNYYWEISAPGTYVFNIPESIFKTSHSSAFNILSGNVCLNLNTKTIQGSDIAGSIGVKAEDKLSVEVRNGTITDMEYGVRFNNVNTGVIDRVHVQSCLKGINLVDSTNFTISGCRLTSNRDIGIWLNSGSTGNTITLNTITKTKDVTNPTASGSGYGILSDSSSNTNIFSKNIIKESRWAGIYLKGTSGNQVIQNTLKNNEWGIHMDRYGMSNKCLKNLAESNKYGIVGDPTSHNNLMSDNDIRSNTKVGILLYKSNSNTVELNRLINNSGTGIHIRSTSKSNNVKKNVISGSKTGIILENAQSNTISSNTVKTNSAIGIYNYNSNKNMVKSNKIESNSMGVVVDGSSSGNIYSRNAITSSSNGGLIIRVPKIYPNTFSSNTITKNSVVGIYLKSTGNQKITNNYLKNSKNVNFYNTVSANTWNIVKTSGKNIINGNFLGGNYWSQPDAKGYSDTCKDSNNDGICDKAYSIPDKSMHVNVDRYPLCQ